MSNNGQCVIEGCNEPVFYRSMCRSHYRKATGESRKRYQKVKNSPRLSKVLRECTKRYHKSEGYRKIKARLDRAYYLRNKKKIAMRKKVWTEEKRFSGKRQAVLERDGNKCMSCGSIERLVVHHVDNKGRGCKKPDNGIENLVTLCRGCHMKVHFWGLVLQ